MFNWIKDKFKGKKDEDIKTDFFEEKENIEEISEENTENIEQDYAKENEETIVTENLDTSSIPSIESDVNNSESNENTVLNVDDIEKNSCYEDTEESLSAEDIKENNIELDQMNTNLNIDSEVDISDSSVTLERDESSNEVEKKPEEKSKVNLFKRLKDGLNKTRQEMGVKINTILGAYVKIDDEMLEDLEDVLISADIGMETTMKLIDNLRETIIQEKINDPNKVMPLLKEEIKKIMNPELSSKVETSKPTVILVIGVNGVGKTTTIGKLSSRLKNEGKNVLVAAADTFRAAAIDQLKTWGNRANVEVISHSEGADPAAVIYDGISAAKSRNADVLICDTAGRLHNKANLMKELEKINKVISRDFPEANRETLLVLDATTGQNAMSQAKTFKEVADITGIVLTKLDGTAKGGVVIALQSELQIPIKLVGVGEQIDDLQDFEMNSFVDAILE